jgi:uncharacterized membrane protein YeiH
MRRLVVAALVAVAVAVFMAVPRIAGIETWKWLLAAVGLTLFILSGQKP